MMTPAERFADMAVEHADVDPEAIKVNDNGIVCPMLFGKGEKPFSLSIIASGRELDMYADKQALESLFLSRLRSALRVAVAHEGETGVTEADMKAMLKKAQAAIQ